MRTNIVSTTPWARAFRLGRAETKKDLVHEALLDRSSHEVGERTPQRSAAQRGERM